jgi:hypothetical protein
MTSTSTLLLIILTTTAFSSAIEVELLGKLTTIYHGVQGSVYMLNDTTLIIKNFFYDGRGPNAFFYVGTAGQPTIDNGVIIPYPKNRPIKTLEMLNDVEIRLDLPNGTKERSDRSNNFGSLSFFLLLSSLVCACLNVPNQTFA